MTLQSRTPIVYHESAAMTRANTTAAVIATFRCCLVFRSSSIA